MTKKSLVPIVLSVMVTVLAAIPAAADRYDFSDHFDQTYALAEGGRVSLENVNGDVKIEAWDRSEVRVQAEKMASSQELLDSLEIEVEAGSEAIRIDTRYHKNRSWFDHDHGHRKVEYTLTVPRNARLDTIDLVNGDLLVVGVEGGVRAETVNGNIVARQVVGTVRLSTVNGRLQPEIDSFERIERIELEAVNGQIELALPSHAAATLRAETVNGSIRNDFGLPVNKHKYVGADLRGDIGGGGAEVQIETVNGGIEIRSR